METPGNSEKLTISELARKQTFEDTARATVNDDDILVKPETITLVEARYQFAGLVEEDPHDHIDDFEDVCESQTYGRTDVYKLLLFKFSLKGKAKKWWRSVPKEIKASWTKVKETFIDEYCPHIQIVNLRDQITTFKQIENELIGEAWTRYKELVRKCPGHGLSEWVVLELFYKGLLPKSKRWVDMSASGALVGKDVDFVRKLLDNVEYNEHQWNPKLTKHSQEKNERESMKKQHHLNVSKILNSHNFDELSNDSSVENIQKQVQAKFSKKERKAMKNQAKHQVQSMTLRSGTKLNQPEDTRVYEQSKEQHLNIEEEDNLQEPPNQGGTAGQPSKRPASRPNCSAESGSKPKLSSLTKATAPYPLRLKPKYTEKQCADFIKLLSQIEIAMPLMEALQQIPVYAKLMKELLTGKRTFDSFETVKATEECSAILLDRLPKKSKDPGSFIIPCTFNDSINIRALCDSGASVNLMPLSIYRKLGLGDLQPTKVTIQLADRSTVYPKGVAEDVIVRVEDLHFPVDFLVMEIEEDRDVPLILGRPFLMTGQAMVNFKEGTLTLSIEEDGATKENTYPAMEGVKLGANFATCFQIDIMDKYIGKQFRRMYLKEPLKEGNPLTELIKANEVKVKETVYFMDTTQWRRKNYKSLGESFSVPKPSIISPPELTLKKLPSHLKYAFLGENSTLPIIIASSLTVMQEGKLLKMLGNYKEAIGWSIADIKGINTMHAQDSYGRELQTYCATSTPLKSKHVRGCKERSTKVIGCRDHLPHFR